MTDQKTIETYDKKAEEYHTRFSIEKPNKTLNLFMDHLKHGAHVLDLGCGPGTWSALMRDAGFSIDAMDASAEMVRIAKEARGIDARIATFDDISGDRIYDGIWANFSLLHATRKAFPQHLSRLYTALKDEGVFHIGMKLGSDAERDHLDRFYTYYSESELKQYLEDTGFQILNCKLGKEVGLAGNEDPFALILCKKP